MTAAMINDEALLDIVRQAIVTVLSVPASELEADTRLVDDLGADSLAMIEIVEVSEEQLRSGGSSVRVDDETLAQLEFLGDLVTALRIAEAA